MFYDTFLRGGACAASKKSMRTKWWHIALFALIMIAAAAALHPTKLRSGWMLVKGGKIHDAIRQIAAVHEKNPENYRAIKALAQAKEETGETGEAALLYEQLLKRKPIDDNFREVVRFYTWNLEPAKALGTYERWFGFRKEKGISFDDDDGRKMVRDLYAQYLIDKDIKRAIDMLKVERALQPDQARVLDNDLVVLYEKMGDLDTTIAELEKILRTDRTNVYALGKFAQIAKLGGKTDVARAFLVKDIERNPTERAAWDRMITFETECGNYRDADAWYKKLLAMNVNDTALKKRYVGWLLATEQQHEAVGYLESLPPEDARDPYFNTTLVQLYEWLNMKGKLLPIYAERFARNPYDRDNAQKLVWLLYDAKKYGMLTRVLSRLASRYPKNKEYARMLVDAYDAQGDAARGTAQLEKAARKSNDPALLKELGERYLWTGSRPRATAASSAATPKKGAAPR